MCVRVAGPAIPIAGHAAQIKCAPRCEAAREKNEMKKAEMRERRRATAQALLNYRAATISGEEKAIFHLANTFATSEIITRCAAK